MSRAAADTARTTDRAAALQERAARRAARVAARLAGGAVQEQEADGATLAALRRYAEQEAQRVPAGVRALASVEADDVAADAWLRLATTADGRTALAALGGRSVSVEARRSAATRARLTVRSLVSNALRAATTAAPDTDTEQEARAALTLAQEARRTLLALMTTDTDGRGVDRAERRGALTDALAEAEALAQEARALLRQRTDTERHAERLAYGGGRTAQEAGAVALALEADGPYERADRDTARGWGFAYTDRAATDTAQRAHRRAGGAALTDTEAGAVAGAVRGAIRQEARRLRAIRERTTARTVRIMRGADLETLLTDTLRAPLPTTGAGAETAGRTLAGMLADRDTRTAWRTVFGAALTDAALDTDGRGAVLVRTAVLALRDAVPADTVHRANAWRRTAALRAREAQEAQREADAAALALTALSGASRAQQNGARQEADAAAQRAARLTAGAEQEAQRADACAVLALLHAERGALTLADAVYVFTATTAPDGGRTGGARRRRSRGEADDGRTTVDTGAVLDFLRLPTATDGAAAKRLRSVLTDAADAATTEAGAAAPSRFPAVFAEREAQRAAQRLADGRTVLAARRRYVTRQRREAQEARAAECAARPPVAYVPAVLSPAQEALAAPVGAVLAALAPLMALALAGAQ